MPEAGTGVDPDRLIIRDLIENWAIWRDALMWDRFRTVWHEDGRMMASTSLARARLPRAR